MKLAAALTPLMALGTNAFSIQSLANGRPNTSLNFYGEPRPVQIIPSVLVRNLQKGDNLPEGETASTLNTGRIDHIYEAEQKGDNLQEGDTGRIDHIYEAEQKGDI